MNFILTKKAFKKQNKEDLVLHDTIGEYQLFIDSQNITTLQNSCRENILILGDCLNSDILLNQKFDPGYIKQLKGIFILLVYNNEYFSLFSSLFGLLPLYYSNDFTSISSSFEYIIQAEKISPDINKRYILESYLFNYTFNNQTYLKEITRLDSFSGIIYKNQKIETVIYEDITTWFPKKVISGKKNLKKLASLFIENSRYYFSNNQNTITFTSGFDGRSIVAAALYHRINFNTYSLGKIENDDVYNPMENAKELKIPYEFYNLGGNEYIGNYKACADEFSLHSGGFNGYLYPHFLYGANMAAQKSDVLLTGYCGSELFRSLHIQGAVTSKELVLLFTETDNKNLKTLLWNSPKLQFLNKDNFEEDFEEMFEELLRFRKKNLQFNNRNHAFYNYVFSEVFRKVFGTWTTVQFQHIKVRIPFLDYNFVEELLKTDLAGCNNEFFTHNPFKRLKGQLLYAEIIRQACPELFKLYTGKGYRPSDLTSILGKIRISIPYFKKKIRKKVIKQNLDNLGLITTYQFNREQLEEQVKTLNFINYDLFYLESKNLNKYTPENLRDVIFQTVSFTQLNINK